MEVLYYHITDEEVEMTSPATMASITDFEKVSIFLILAHTSPIWTFLILILSLGKNSEVDK